MDKRMIAGAILAQLWLILGAYACLTPPQLDTINMLANITNISNDSLASIFNVSCHYYDVNITQINSNISMMHSNISTFFNANATLNGSIRSIGGRIDELNASLAGKMAYLNTTLNSTMFNEDEKLEARLNTKYMQNITSLINESIFNISQTWFNEWSIGTESSFSSNLTMMKDMMDVSTESVYEKLASKYDLNTTKDRLENADEIIRATMANELNNVKLWIGMGALIVVVVVLFFRSKTNYPKVFSKIKLLPRITTPTELEEESELDEKSKISAMREFILNQKQFSGKARADAYRRYMNNEFDKEEDALKHMELFDMEKAEKKGGKVAKHKV